MVLKSFAQGKLFGEQFGAEPPRVVALHGWGRDRSDLAGAVAGIGAISLDLPGFGASPAPDAPCGTGWYADQVVWLLEELDRPVVLVGHSFGGRVAVVVAARRPELVSGLVLTGVPLLRRTDRAPARSPLRYRVIRRLAGAGLISGDRLEAARRRHGSADYRQASGVMRDVLVTVVNEEYPDELAALRCPVALVWGADDTDAPPSTAERAMGMISAPATLTVLDGVGHFVPTAAPDALRSAVEGML